MMFSGVIIVIINTIVSVSFSVANVNAIIVQSGGFRSHPHLELGLNLVFDCKC